MVGKEKLSRRNFFRLVGGGVAAAIAAPYVIKEAVAEQITRIPVEFGWTWHIDKTKLPNSKFAEIITKTLRDNTQKLSENISQNNALLVKLHNKQKVILDIERISPEDQNQRIKVRLQQRLEDRLKNIIDHRPQKGGRLYTPDNTRKNEEKTFYVGYGSDLEKKYNDS